jgi:hypothetical protein
MECKKLQVMRDQAYVFDMFHMYRNTAHGMACFYKQNVVRLINKERIEIAEVEVNNGLVVVPNNTSA